MIICGYTLQSGHDNLPHIHLGLVNLPQFSALRAAELDKSWSCWLGNVVVMSKGCAVNLLAKPANFVCQCALIMIVPEYVDCFLFVFSPSPRPPPPPHHHLILAHQSFHSSHVRTQRKNVFNWPYTITTQTPVIYSALMLRTPSQWTSLISTQNYNHNFQKTIFIFYVIDFEQ